MSLTKALKELWGKLAGDGGAVSVGLRLSAAGVCVLVTHVVTRMAVRITLYRWRRRKLGGFEHIPWIWDDRGPDAEKAPGVYKALPLLMQVDPSGGLEDYLALLRNPSDGSIRPIVYSGGSVAFEPTVTISDSKYFSQILNDLESFPKYKEFYNLLDPILGSGLVTASGEEHRKKRKIITPVFHFAALKAAMSLIERNALKFVESDLPAKNFTISQDTFKIFTMGVITDYAFSGSFDKKWMESSWHNIMKVFILQNLCRMFIGEFVRYIPNPCSVYIALVRWKIAGYLAERRRLLRDKNITHDAVLQAVGDDQDPPAGSGAAAAAATAGISIELGMNLADQLLLSGSPTARVLDECSTFLFAGEDTTSTLLGWASHELSRHPDIQALARDEVRRVFGAGAVGAVSYEALKRLEYIPAVLREALRLWPPVPLLPRRNLRPDLVVAGMAVPAGTIVELNFAGIHRDPAVWPAPDEFRPARWLLAAGDPEAARRHPYAFLPFSAGPRNCIGQKFAMEEATAMLAVLLSRFELRPGTGRVTPVLVGTMEPAGLAVRCVPL